MSGGLISRSFRFPGSRAVRRGSIAKKDPEMPAAKPPATPRALVSIEAESGTAGRRVRLAKVLAARPAARIPDIAAPLPSKAQQRKSAAKRYKLPDDENAQLGALKQRLQALGTDVKKSQLLRAGLALLVAMNDAQLTRAMANIGIVKAECQPQRVS